MRVKRGFRARRRRNKILNQTSGFRGRRGTIFRVAKNSLFKALQYAFRDRRAKKRSMRALWIARINAGARINGISYSRLIHALKKAGVELDRKVLAAVALHDPDGFRTIVKSVA
jgi:large subunit ribosomal protein L20